MMYILQSENLKMHFTSYFYVININYASQSTLINYLQLCFSPLGGVCATSLTLFP